MGAGRNAAHTTLRVIYPSKFASARASNKTRMDEIIKQNTFVWRTVMACS